MRFAILGPVVMAREDRENSQLNLQLQNALGDAKGMNPNQKH